MRRTLAVGLVLFVLVVAPVTAGAASASPAGDSGLPGPTATGGVGDPGTAAGSAAAGDACEALAGGEQRPDPDADTLGWENGCWYDDPIAVDPSDGLNETELDAVVARSMARVEQIRELEFEATVPVEVISRETFQNQSDPDLSEDERLHQNVKWEAMLMVNESTDAVAVRQANRGSSVLGYYSPAEERIVIVSENTTSPKMDEITLSQELFHALQDQHFNLSAYNQTTEERHNAVDGLVEGDGNYVDYLYDQRCILEWDCLRPQESGGGGGDLHVGQYIVTFAPYSEGPEFVRELQEEGGWEAVDAAYEDPPTSTEQIIHHEKYGEDEPTPVGIDDRSSNGWHVLELETGIDYAEYGEAGLFSMFWYASFEETAERQAATTIVIPYRDFFEYEDRQTGELESIGPYSYAHEATEGWDGDKLLPYVNDSSSATNETGYVWKTAWDSDADAREFADAYAELLAYRGAEPVDDRRNTYRIPEGEEFADAFYVTRNGDRVVVVNAPTVAALDDVRAGAAPEATPTAPATSVDGTAATGTDARTDATPTDATTPGFGLLVGVLAGLAATLLVRRR